MNGQEYTYKPDGDNISMENNKITNLSDAENYKEALAYGQTQPLNDEGLALWADRPAALDVNILGALSAIKDVQIFNAVLGTKYKITTLTNKHATYGYKVIVKDQTDTTLYELDVVAQIKNVDAINEIVLELSDGATMRATIDFSIEIGGIIFNSSTTGVYINSTRYISKYYIPTDKSGLIPFDNMVRDPFLETATAGVEPSDMDFQGRVLPEIIDTESNVYGEKTIYCTIGKPAGVADDVRVVQYIDIAEHNIGGELRLGCYLKSDTTKKILGSFAYYTTEAGVILGTEYGTNVAIDTPTEWTFVDFGAIDISNDTSTAKAQVAFRFRGSNLDDDETVHIWMSGITMNVFEINEIAPRPNHKLDIEETILRKPDLKISVWGDSISASGLYYSDYMVENLNCTLDVRAVSGDMAVNQVDDLKALMISTPNYFDDYDFVYLWVGTNDVKAPYALGTMASAKDDADYVGQVKYWIETILAANPSIRMALVTTMEMDYAGHLEYKQANSLGATVRDFVDMQIALANYYTLPIINVGLEMGLTKDTIPTLLADGVHPNTGEGRYRIARIFSSKILDLFKYQ